MKPIKLVIDGINSYSMKQEIDFLRLTEKGLFGIFGKTGSGKSTILDAMTLSLYGKIPRQTKEYINSDRDKAVVEYEFEIGRGSDRKNYKISRRFKKSQGKTNSDYCRLLEKNSFGEYDVIEEGVKKVDSKVLDIIGLSYDDFLRSVVLPQGKFSEFLVLSGKSRRDMLERIFKLKEYGSNLTNKVSSKRKEIENEIEVLKGRIGEYANINEELKSLLENSIKEKTSELESLNKNFSQENKLLIEYREVLGLLRQKSIEEKNIENLSLKKEDIEKLESMLKDHEKSSKLKSTIDFRRKLVYDINNLSNKKIGLEKEYKIFKKKLEEKNDEFEKVEISRNKIIELSSSKNNMINYCDVEGEIISFTKDRKVHIANIDKNKEEYIKVDSNYKKLLEEVSSIEEEGIKLANKIKEYNLMEKDRNGIRKGFEISETIVSNLKRVKKFVGKKDRLEKEKKELSKISEDIKKKGDEMSLNNLTHEIISMIEKNHLSICPVCKNKIDDNKMNMVGGSLENNSVDSSELEIEKARDDIENKLKEVEENIIKCDINISSLLENNATNLSNLRDIVDENSIIRVKTEILGRINTILSNSDYKEGELESLKDNFCKLNDIVNSFETEMKSNEKKREELRKKYKNTKSLLDNATKFKVDIDKNLASLNTMIDSLDKSIKKNIDKREEIKNKIKLDNFIEFFDSNNDLSIDKSRIFEIEYLTEVISRSKIIEDNIYKKYEILKSEIDLAKKNYDEIKINLKEIVATLNVNINSEKEHKTSIEKSIIEYGFNSEDDVLEKYLEEDLVNSYKSTIEKFLDDMSQAKARLDSYSEKLGDRFVKEDEVIYKEEICISLNTRIKSLESDLYTEKYRLKDVIEGLEKIKSIKNELDDKVKLYNNIKMIEDIFKGNRFVEYLSQIYLKNIVVDASQRLYDITNGRYLLEIDEDYQFVISDNFNGGMRRSADTLSGGEIFLTSLSLALALSSQIQLKGSAPLEFFFLDEGFGTLDNELLNTVMESLEKIHSKTLSVGIISHVEEIKERIPVKLVIDMDDKISSSVVNLIET